MSDTLTLDLPHAMIQGINKACKKDGYTSQEFIRTAISKMLFEQFKPAPESNILVTKEMCLGSRGDSGDPCYEIPLERIIAVRYTLDDGKMIHIMRGKKPC
ncbi:MAG: ribbon-helix-helix domain-containing protein [Nitrosotalea sp.]